MIFASEPWIAEHPEQVGIIVRELLRLWRESRDNPVIVEEFWDLGPLNAAKEKLGG